MFLPPKYKHKRADTRKAYTVQEREMDMTQGILYGIGFIVALGLALVLTPIVIKLAHKVGALDKPNHRKVHTRIMPRLGGLAIYGAFVIAYFALKPFIPEGLLRSYDSNLINALLAGGSIIVIIGALDDRFELSAKVKLLGQIIAGCVVVLGFGVKIDLLNIPFGQSMQPIAAWISIPLTILWIVGVTNAINLIDGLDGLAAGVSGIAIGTILVMAAHHRPCCCAERIADHCAHDRAAALLREPDQRGRYTGAVGEWR